MTPKFAVAVDPIFLCVLGLLDQISQNETIPVEECASGSRIAFARPMPC